MKSQTENYVASIGDKVNNRQTNESAVVAALCTNEAGRWYYMQTASGMSIGWWHETDFAAMPRSIPPTTKRTKKAQAA